MQRKWLGASVLVAVLAISAGCGSSSNQSAKSTTSGVAGAQKTVVNKSVSGSVTFDGIWTGAEATAFGKVIKAFNKVYPKVHVKYKPVGNNVPTVLATAVAGGHPPDMADIAQPGLVKQLAEQGHLKPITYAKGTIAKNFAPAWRQLGTVNGKLYALVFKASNKSLLWYNVPAYKAAGVKAPKTWSQLISNAKTLKASGTPAYSVGGADGWTLTDLFENIYLRTYGPAKYNALSAHKIKWTDPTVTKALKTMAQVIGDSSNLAGGTSGALQYGFNDSVTNAFTSPPKAATVLEGDFVAGVILSSTKAKPKTGFNAVPFPS
ncbi:MAG: ABC transporter substrate-binding protein, partial [Gaiellaceae bacterium]